MSKGTESFIYPSMGGEKTLDDALKELTPARRKTFNYPSMGTPREDGERMSHEESRAELSEEDTLTGRERIFDFPKMDQQKKQQEAAFRRTNPGAHAPKPPDYLFDYPSLDEDAPTPQLGLNENPEEEQEKDVEQKKAVDGRLGELLELNEKGDWEGLAEELRSDLIEMGAEARDLELVDYLKEIVTDTGNEELKSWCTDFICWIYQENKNR